MINNKELYTNWYILKNKIPVKCNDLNELSTFNSSTEKIIKKSYIEDCELSTVFLGLDHNFSNSGKPVLFETIFFYKTIASDSILLLYRYCHYHTALNNHNRLWKIIEYMFNTDLNNLPIYINNEDFRGYIANYRLKRGF